MRSMILGGWLAALLVITGCSTTREITISAQPADAMLSIDGQSQGPGPITHKFVFHNDQDEHDVTASRIGFKDQTIHLMRAYDTSSLLIELKPQSKRISFSVQPVPAVVKLDGKPIGSGTLSQGSMELEFTADAQGHWTTHTLEAQRADWSPVRQVIKWTDPSPNYVLALGAVKKDLSISSTPSGAQVSLDGQAVGQTPLKLPGVAFPVDPESGEFIPHRLIVSKPGYDPYSSNISWDDGKEDYQVDIPPKTKTVRIISDPPGATVTINGHRLVPDREGVVLAPLVFVPSDERGTLPEFKAEITKKTADTEWYPADLSIGWEGGRTDYRVALREIRTRPVTLIQAEPRRTDDGWRIEPKTTQTLAMKDVTEPSDREQPTRITDLPRGTVIDSLSVSPDGSSLLYSTISTDASGKLHSRIEMMKSDGSNPSTVLSEPSALSLMPSFTTDGSQILFSSNRATSRLAIWETSALGEAGITQLTGGEENALWPVADSSAKPRLFYEALVDALPQPRLYVTRVGTTMRTDLARGGGMQPSINPKGDRVVFCSISERTGKRQLQIIPDRGGPPTSIGDVDADEFDPVWSKDGGKIAYVSNRGKNDETGNNFDIWVLDLNHLDRPIQVTQNGSWDDCPQWDPSGRSLYFRSNRGGQWAIWKIAVPSTNTENSQGTSR